MTSHGKGAAQQLSLYRNHVANARRSPTRLTWVLLADVAAALLAACTAVRNGGTGFNNRFVLLSAAISLQTWENEAAQAHFKRMHCMEHRLFAEHCVWAKEGQWTSRAEPKAGGHSGRESPDWTLRRALEECSPWSLKWWNGYSLEGCCVEPELSTEGFWRSLERE